MTLSQIYADSANLNIIAATDIQIAIYDACGRIVRQLINGQHNPGQYTIVWDGCDNKGVTVAPGVYFLSFRMPEYKKI